jgi:PhnB protein
VADQFYGDRVVVLVDPFGRSWSFASHIEDVSPGEMKKARGRRARVIGRGGGGVASLRTRGR